MSHQWHTGELMAATRSPDNLQLVSASSCTMTICVPQLHISSVKLSGAYQRIHTNGIDVDATQRSLRDVITTAQSWRQ